MKQSPPTFDLYPEDIERHIRSVATILHMVDEQSIQAHLEKNGLRPEDARLILKAAQVYANKPE